MLVNEYLSQDRLNVLTNSQGSAASADIQLLNGRLNLQDLQSLAGIDVVMLNATAEEQQQAREALAAREGAIIPLVTDARELAARCLLERHVCIDTTAAGGNASLLAATEA